MIATQVIVFRHPNSEKEDNGCLTDMFAISYMLRICVLAESHCTVEKEVDMGEILYRVRSPSSKIRLYLRYLSCERDTKDHGLRQYALDGKNCITTGADTGYREAPDRRSNMLPSIVSSLSMVEEVAILYSLYQRHVLLQTPK